MQTVKEEDTIEELEVKAENSRKEYAEQKSNDFDIKKFKNYSVV